MTDATAPPPPRWKRRWLIAIAALLGLLVVATAALHLPFARGRVLSYVIAQLASQGMRLEAAGLEYNLLALRVTLRDVRVTADGKDIPFFEAERVEANVPWAVIRGRIHVQSLDVAQPRVTIVRGADGTLNLPTFGDDDDEGSFEGPVYIDRLSIAGLTFRYDDPARAHMARSGALALNMDSAPGGPLDGRLTMDGQTTLQFADIATTMTVLDGDVSFDGTRLAVDPLVIETPELQARISGGVDVLGPDPELDIRYQLQGDVARIAPWMALDPSPAGRLAIDGTASGAMDDPVVTASVTSTDLTWPGLGAVALDAQASWTGTTATIERLHLTAASGELTAEGHIGTDEATESAVTAEWQGIDLDHVLRAFAATPTRIASFTDGTASLAWTGTDVLAGRAEVSTTLRAASGRAGTLPVSGPARMTLADRQWRLTTSPALGSALSLEADARGTLTADTSRLMESTLGGRATLAVADAGETARLLHAAGLAPELGDDRLRGSLTGDFALGGTFGNPRVTGSIDSPDLAFDTTGPAVVHARIDATPRLAVIEAARVEVDGNTIDASGRVGIADNTVDATLAARLPDVAALAAVLPEAWRPAGAASIDAVASGALDNPVVDLTATARDILVAGQAIAAVDLQAQLANRVVTVPSAELTQADGRLSITGRYGLDDRAYTFSAVGDGLAIVPLVLASSEGASEVPIDARFNLRLDGSGTIDTPRASGQIDFSTLTWDAYQLGAAHADLAVDGDVATAKVTLPSVQATADTAMAIEAGTFEATVDIADADLAALVRSTGPAGPIDPAVEAPPVVGTLSLQATASGRLDDMASMAVTVDLGSAEATVNGLPVRLQQPARLRYDGQTAGAEQVAMRIGNLDLTAHGRLGPGAEADDALEVAVTGSIGDLMPLVRMAEGAEQVEAAGDLDVRVRAAGSFRAPDVIAYLSLTDASLAMAGLPAVSDLSMGASYSAGWLNVSTLAGTWQGASIAATAHVPASLMAEQLPAEYLASLDLTGAPARADVHLIGITPQALEPFASAETVAEFAGRVDLTAYLEAPSTDLDTVTADVTLTHADVEISRLPLAQAFPTQLRFVNQRLDVVEWSWTGPGTAFDVAGYVNFAGETPDLNLGASGTFDLRMISAFSRELGTEGRADFDVRALGATADPAISGRVAIADASVILRNPRLAITEMAGDIILTPNRVQFDDLDASANGGTIEVGGAVDYAAFAVTGGTLTVTGRQLAIEAVDGLRTEIDADLALGVSNETPVLEGKVTVVRGDYRRALRLTDLLGERAPRIATIDTEPGPLDRLQLNVAVVSAEDIHIDNNYGRMDLASNLRVIGTAASPVLSGRLTLREGGEVYLGGQTYQVRRGTIDFTNATRIEPTINLALDTRVQRYDVALEVSGTPQTLDVAVRSPGLPQQDAISLLLTGQPTDGSTMAYGDVARGQLIMLLSGEVLGVAGRSIGLDSVQVARGLGGAASTFDLLATQSDPGTRLTVSKNLSRYLELIFSQSLRNSGDITWIAAYRPIRNIELRGTTSDDNSQTYEFRHDLELGRSGPRPAAETRPDDPMVAAVHISGDPGFPEADLRRRLRIEAGDRFDYFRWIEDRDRLLDFFHDRGYLEARLTARRTSAADNRVILEYAIERGPATRVAVEGYALPSGVIEDVRTAWERSVFDGFLIDDAAAIARAHLIDRDHLQATIDVTVQPDTDGGKVLTVRIDPGPRFDTRQLAFEGNRQVADQALLATIRAQRLEQLAWQDPAALAGALEAYYQSLGYLSASAAPQPPVFDGTTATLPFAVSEGDPFLIETVDITGAVSTPVAEIQEMLAMGPGDAYRPATIEPARRRIEVAYLEQGFNEVRVTTDITANADTARIDMVLAIEEGPKEVLAGIDVAGADTTARGTVVDALDLDVGEPIDMSAVYAAQKRLYDTGVFQTVDISLTPATANATEAAPNATPDPTTDTIVQPVTASIVVSELPRYRFRYGFRATDITEPIEGTRTLSRREIRPAIVVDLLDRNVLGRAVAAGAAGQLEFDRWLARGILSLPRLAGLPVSSNVFLTRSHERREPEGALPFVEDALELTFEQRFKPADSMTTIWGYSFTKTHTFELNPVPDPIFPPLDDRTDIGRLTATYAWDTRDDPSDARRGWFHSSGVEYGAHWMASDLRFVRYLTQQFYFHPVGDTVLASAVRLGIGRGLGQDLVPHLRFFAGGGTTVRGFPQDGLGPSDFFGPTGGNSMFVANQEVRVPITRWLRGVGFIDAGNVFPTIRDMRLRGLEVGTGLGLRINSPIAVLRIDYGVPLTNRDVYTRARWYFAFGQTF